MLLFAKKDPKKNPIQKKNGKTTFLGRELLAKPPAQPTWTNPKWPVPSGS